MPVFHITFLILLILAEVVRFPHRQRNKRELREKRLAKSQVSGWIISLDLLAFLGTEVIPLVYIFSNWLDFADYRLTPTVQWIIGTAGALIFFCGLVLLWIAHRDLGKSWTPSLEITSEHRLITTGIYARIRHPIYAAMWLFVIGQALLLQNWIAGLIGLLTFLPVYFIRTPREEQMLSEYFGEEYRIYRQQTGAIFPKI
jgi:protein-S-isoprenylcysteine O-methyltransferase Ste14